MATTIEGMARVVVEGVMEMAGNMAKTGMTNQEPVGTRTHFAGKATSGWGWGGELDTSPMHVKTIPDQTQVVSAGLLRG